MASHHASIYINASTQQVFKALTDAGLVKLWQYGKQLQCSWQVGSDIVFTADHDGKVLTQHGTVLEVKPGAVVKYNLFTPKPGLADAPENYTTTTYLLSEENGRTKLELIQEDNNAAFVPVSLMPILAKLKHVIEDQ